MSKYLQYIFLKRSEMEVCFSLVRLKIAVDNAIVVKVLECQDCLSKVHSGHFYRQGAHILQQVGTITP